MIFKQQMAKLAAAIKQRLQRRRKTTTARQPEGGEEDAAAAHCDNSLNELLESRLREIIAASPKQSLENPTLLHAIVPACPDSVCKYYRLTVQTCFQTAQPQYG